MSLSRPSRGDPLNRKDEVQSTLDHRKTNVKESVPELEREKNSIYTVDPECKIVDDEDVKLNMSIQKLGIGIFLVFCLGGVVGGLTYYLATRQDAENPVSTEYITQSPQVETTRPIKVEVALKDYIGYAINAASAITFDYSSKVLRNGSAEQIIWTQQRSFFKKTIPETHLITVKDYESASTLLADNIADLLMNIYGVHLGSSYIESHLQKRLWNGILAHVSNATNATLAIDIHRIPRSSVELNLEDKQLWIRRTKEYVNDEILSALSALNKLPKDNIEVQQFLDFFDNYGTHVVVNVASGARVLYMDVAYPGGSYEKHCVTCGGTGILNECNLKSIRGFKKSGTKETISAFKYLPMWDMLRLFGDEYEKAAKNLEKVYKERYVNKLA